MEQRDNVKCGKAAKKMILTDFIANGKMQIISVVVGYLFILYRDFQIVERFFKCIGINNPKNLKDAELFSV